MKRPSTSFERRKQRVRAALRRKTRQQHPRLSVYRSNKHIYAQVIDDTRGITLATASTMEKALRDELKNGSDKAAATRVGQLVGERAVAAGLKAVMFDRGGHRYHGRVKALADAARESGLSF